MARLTLELAMRAIEGAVGQAAMEGRYAAVAVVDEGGHLVAFQRMDQARFHYVKVAIAKAYTAAASGRATRDLVPGPEKAEARANLRSVDPQYIFQPGGFPITIDGEVVGAIGVSGPGSEFDERCAEAALSVLESSTRKAQV